MNEKGGKRAGEERRGSIRDGVVRADEEQRAKLLFPPTPLSHGSAPAVKEKEEEGGGKKRRGGETLRDSSHTKRL